MQKPQILTPQNICKLGDKLSLMFKYGSYGTDLDTFVPYAFVQDSNVGKFSKGLRISIDIALAQSSNIVIPFGASFTSNEPEDFNWRNIVDEDMAPFDMPTFTFKWADKESGVRYECEVSGTAILFSSYEKNSENKLFAIDIA